MSADIFPNKKAANIPNSIPKMPPFCYFALFLFVLETRFINKPESSKDVTIFIISSIILFEIVSVVVTEPRFIF